MSKVTSQRRLCGEIQLFDLCSRDVCQHREGRFCSNEELLARFEAIKEEDERSSDRFIAENPDNLDDADDHDYDDEYDSDNYDEPEMEDD